ncbi:MAG: 6-hydroxymethylpterin diphosphokinase MptE-like protein, partial [Planctomycetota bacterium]
MTSFISESPAAPPDQAILKANLQALARHAPRLVRELEQTTPRRDITFSPSEQDVLTGELDSRALASRRRPLDEARRWADGIDLTKAGGVVVLGFGLGHHIGALAQRCRGISCIVVFEPDLGLLRAVLEHIDHSAWLAHAQLIMLTDATNASVMSQAVCGHEGPLAVGIEFVEHPPSRPRLREHASRFTETFARVFGALRTNVITTMMQTDVTVRNELMNVEHYVGCPGIADLTDMCAGKPAIVVAAGPSLERNIHLLTSPGAQQRCVIIAVQTVLRQLLEAGIRPHFVTAIDYHEISKRFYEGLTADDVEGVTLVAAARANPAILDAYPGDIRIPEDDFLDELLGPDFARDRGALPPAATVAHHAYYLARALGADPVILVGQDLAFTDGQYYARGAAIHDVWAPELNAFNTLEMMEWQRIVRTRATLHRATDHLGRPVYTDEQMATYLAQFERDFLPDVEAGRTVIDATEGGVQKRHTTAMPLADALAQYASDDAAQVPDALRATPVRSTQRHADAEARLEDVRGGV